MEKFNPVNKAIEEAYRKIHTNPDFYAKNEGSFEEKPDLTPLDTFAIPAEILESKETFLEWFEPRFFKFSDEKGGIDKNALAEFSKDLQEAVDFLKSNPYILSPRVDKGFALSKKPGDKVEAGFDNLEEVMAFFKKVAVANTSENTKDYFSPDRKSLTGGEKITHCRILSVAYVIERIKKSHAFRDFLEHSRFVLGRDKEKGPESGILSNLVIPKELDILLDRESEALKIFEWVERNQKVAGCNFNNIGEEERKHSYHIPEVQIGIKEGLRTFLKYLRSPKEAFKIADDFLRFRFIFNDNMETEKMLELMHDIQAEAKRKKDPRVEIEFREKNYLSEEDLEAYFPEKSKKGNKRKGILDNIKIDKNPASGKGYKNMSAKVKLYNPGGRRYYFAFEIVFVRKSEHRENERLERPANHFLMEMRQSTELTSRMTGKMKKEEMILALKNYLEINIKTEEIPSVLIGDAKDSERYGSSVMEVDFAGSIDKKAQILFDFLLNEGTIKKVSADFPSQKKPTQKKRDQSVWYIWGANRDRILDASGAEK
ncbi:MAG: hypothetical protein WAV31_01210 [Candidatus Moraniibacteriota bacterium]